MLFTRLCEETLFTLENKVEVGHVVIQYLIHLFNYNLEIRVISRRLRWSPKMLSKTVIKISELEEQSKQFV